MTPSTIAISRYHEAFHVGDSGADLARYATHVKTANKAPPSSPNTQGEQTGS